MPDEQQQQQPQREHSAEPNRLYALLAPLVTETDKEVQNVAATQAALDKAVAHFTQRITFSRSSAGGWLPHHVRPPFLRVREAEGKECSPLVLLPPCSAE